MRQSYDSFVRICGHTTVSRADGGSRGGGQRLLEAVVHATALGHAVHLAGDEHHVQPGQVLRLQAAIGVANEFGPRVGGIEIQVDASSSAHSGEGILHQLLDQVLKRPAALLLRETLGRNGGSLTLGHDGGCQPAPWVVSIPAIPCKTMIVRDGSKELPLVHVSPVCPKAGRTTVALGVANGSVLSTGSV